VKEKLKILRTMLDSKEEHYRWLGERVERADWAGRFKEMQHNLSEWGNQCLEHAEKLHVLRAVVQIGGLRRNAEAWK